MKESAQNVSQDLLICREKLKNQVQNSAKLANRVSSLSSNNEALETYIYSLENPSVEVEQNKNASALDNSSIPEGYISQDQCNAEKLEATAALTQCDANDVTELETLRGDHNFFLVALHVYKINDLLRNIELIIKDNTGYDKLKSDLESLQKDLDSFIDGKTDLSYDDLLDRYNQLNLDKAAEEVSGIIKEAMTTYSALFHNNPFVVESAGDIILLNCEDGYVYKKDGCSDLENKFHASQSDNNLCCNPCADYEFHIWKNDESCSNDFAGQPAAQWAGGICCQTV